MTDLIKLHKYVLKLKSLKRAGWINHNISNSESVSDHSFSTSFLVMIMAEKLNLNVEKCLKLALIHDLAESIINDITPHEKISQIEKLTLEEKAIKKIATETGFEFLIDLTNEYNQNKSKESILVHDMDKMDMLLQALEYENKQKKDLSEFFTYTKERLQLIESKELYKKIYQLRNNNFQV